MHPIAARFGDLTIATHDVFSVLGVLVGFAIYYYELRRRGWLDQRIVLVSVAALVGATVGARVATAWESPDWWVPYAVLPLSQALEVSGKSIIGAIAGGYLAIVASKRALGYRRSTGDAYVLAIPVATIIGRVGCFLSELPLGTPTSLPWGISVDAGPPMHPTMLYEIAFNTLAVVAIVRWRDRVPAAGDALKLYLLAAATFRFGVEYLRTSPRLALDLTAPQWVLVPMLALLVIHFARQARRGAWRVPIAPRPMEAAT